MMIPSSFLSWYSHPFPTMEYPSSIHFHKILPSQKAKVNNFKSTVQPRLSKPQCEPKLVWIIGGIQLIEAWHLKKLEINS